jgi:hypothetical protein
MAWEVSVMAIPAVRSNLFCFVKQKRFPLPSWLKSYRIDFIFLSINLERLTFAPTTTQQHEYNHHYKFPIPRTKNGLPR